MGAGNRWRYEDAISRVVLFVGVDFEGLVKTSWDAIPRENLRHAYFIVKILMSSALSFQRLRMTSF